MSTGLQRSQGKLKVGLARGQDDATRVANLFQGGCLNARLPRPQHASEADVVIINTAGGITGGDHLSVDVTVGDGTRVTVTTPACERVYRSVEGEALIEQRVRVGRGARLDWVPQEVILYDRSRLRRRLDLQLEGGAEITMVEAVLLGRAAMGELVTGGSFYDFRTIRRDTCLIFADATRMANAFGHARSCPSMLGDYAAMANLVYIGPDLAAKRDALRAGFADCAHAQAGASVIGEVLSARIVATGGSALRRVLMTALTVLRDARPLPRLWTC